MIVINISRYYFTREEKILKVNANTNKILKFNFGLLKLNFNKITNEYLRFCSMVLEIDSFFTCILTHNQWKELNKIKTNKRLKLFYKFIFTRLKYKSKY